MMPPRPRPSAAARSRSRSKRPGQKLGAMPGGGRGPPSHRLFRSGGRRHCLVGPSRRGGTSTPMRWPTASNGRALLDTGRRIISGKGAPARDTPSRRRSRTTRRHARAWCPVAASPMPGPTDRAQGSVGGRRSPRTGGPPRPGAIARARCGDGSATGRSATSTARVSGVSLLSAGVIASFYQVILHERCRVIHARGSIFYFTCGVKMPRLWDYLCPNVGDLEVFVALLVR